MPSFKARFDYGAMIFILTFSLVSVGGYRVDKLVDMAQERVSTIAIGTSICIIITVFFCPIWVGTQLHRLVQRNFVKLADSLDGKGDNKIGNLSRKVPSLAMIFDYISLKLQAV